jgi:hypothetical protein
LHLWAFLLSFTGSDGAGTRWNLFWSGFGGGPLAWLALPLVYLRHHNCHEVWCIRLGRHQHPDGGKYCRKHHLLMKGIK